jgi:phytoene/squalene synthetase
VDSDIAYCLSQIRRFDRDRYLTVLVAPRDLASDLAVLYAFNLELALVRDSVSEVMLGRIRLQWWREAITALHALEAGEPPAGPPRRHAVLVALAELFARRRLRRQWFERMIEARERELDAEVPADLAGLESYAADASGSLIALALEAAGLDPDAGDLPELVRHVGIAYGLTGIARATLFLAARRRTLLPASLIAANGLSLDRLFDLKPQPGLAGAVASLAAAARGHLDAARRLQAPRRALPALRIGNLARAQLARLERRGYDLFDPRSIAASPFDIWRLAGHRLAGSWQPRISSLRRPSGSR